MSHLDPKDFGFRQKTTRAPTKRARKRVVRRNVIRSGLMTTSHGDLMVKHPPAKDWLIRVVERVTGKPGFRFRVTGENLNYPKGSRDRKFSWVVPDIDDPRFDLSKAKRKDRR